MIKLTKGSKPAVLAANEVAWTKVIKDKLSKGQKPTPHELRRYAHSDIKQALIDETHGKCAYCESKVSHVSHGDVEHITPKSVVPDLRFDWANLTFACEVCNGKKSNFLGNHDTFVDPYLVDPEEYFVHFGSVVMASPGREAAQITERVLDLNRPKLVERRAERLKYLSDLLDVIAKTKDPTLKDVMRQDFLRELEASREFAALSRAFARVMKDSDVAPAI